MADWFGLNQSKYQWALNDYYENKGVVSIFKHKNWIFAFFFWLNLSVDLATSAFPLLLNFSGIFCLFICVFF